VLSSQRQTLNKTEPISVKNFKKKVVEEDMTSIGMEESMFEMDSMTLTEIF